MSFFDDNYIDQFSPYNPEAWSTYKDWYYSYLDSWQWSVIRDAVMERDDHTCECGDHATQVHHLTYDNVGDEELDDLVAICRDCHEFEHGLKPTVEQMVADLNVVFNLFPPKAST